MKTFLIFLVALCIFQYVYAIFGGENTTIETYPFAVRIANHLHSCMGFIVTNKIVVTDISCAKECLSNIPGQCGCKVYAGATERSKGLPFEISHIVENENFQYTNVSLENNVALIKLQDQFVFNSTIQPIPYPIIDIAEGTTVYIVGWGSTTTTTTATLSASTILQSAELKVISHDDCKKAYDPYFKVSANMTCASAPGKDACIGDNGGPLIFKNSTGHIAVGVLFLTQKSCSNITNNKFPIISTNMSSVSSWIDNKIAELSQCTTCNDYCPIKLPLSLV